MPKKTRPSKKLEMPKSASSKEETISNILCLSKEDSLGVAVFITAMTSEKGVSPADFIQRAKDFLKALNEAEW